MHSLSYCHPTASGARPGKLQQKIWDGGWGGQAKVLSLHSKIFIAGELRDGLYREDTRR